MKKKTIIIIITLVAIIILSLFSIYYDSARVRNGKEPKLTLKIVTNEGKKVTYLGLGYKVIRYPNTNEKEPYENNIGVKFGNWFMKYNKPKIDTKPSTQKEETLNQNDNIENNTTENNEVPKEENTKPEVKPPLINDETKVEDNILTIKNITDTTKNMTEFACAQAIDVFYQDANYKYYYTCIRSSYIIVEYTNGTKENIKEALKNKHITITDLDKYNIKYLKEQNQNYTK